MVNETYHGWLTFSVESKINGAIFDTSAVNFFFFSLETLAFNLTAECERDGATNRL
jgi:hypothetical protein